MSSLPYRAGVREHRGNAAPSSPARVDIPPSFAARHCPCCTSVPERCSWRFLVSRWTAVVPPAAIGVTLLAVALILLLPTGAAPSPQSLPF